MCNKEVMHLLPPDKAITMADLEMSEASNLIPHLNGILSHRPEVHKMAIQLHGLLNLHKVTLDEILEMMPLMKDLKT